MGTGNGRDTERARTMIREFIVWMDKRLGRRNKKLILRPRNYGNK